jgi:glycosyltransferase involved in cell wall biosynthesis
LLLSVGRLHPQKGYDLLVDVAARWRGRQPQPLLAIAGAVEALLDDPARRDELAARAREQAADWPTEADTVAQVEAVYAELLE